MGMGRWTAVVALRLRGAIALVVAIVVGCACATQKTKITELFKNALAAVGAPENTNGSSSAQTAEPR